MRVTGTFHCSAINNQPLKYTHWHIDPDCFNPNPWASRYPVRWSKPPSWPTQRPYRKRDGSIPSSDAAAVYGHAAQDRAVAVTGGIGGARSGASSVTRGRERDNCPRIGRKTPSFGCFAAKAEQNWSKEHRGRGICLQKQALLALAKRLTTVRRCITI